MEVRVFKELDRLVEVWQAHTDAEFIHHSAEQALATMTDTPHLLNIPTMVGGFGREEIFHFYSHYFIPYIPKDTETRLITRTVGQNRIVDEQVFICTHDIYMPWMLPGIPATGKRIEVPMIALIQFRDGLIESEHIYWDQAGVLAQLGLLDNKTLPIMGMESVKRLCDPKLPANVLIERPENLPLLQKRS